MSRGPRGAEGASETANGRPAGGPRTVAFTICSNNYLAQAKTLADSFKLHNPDVVFVIGLVDRLSPEIDYASLGPFEIVLVEDLAIPEFETFWQRYTVMELNTATKPFYFRRLFERYSPDVVVYFDPDIQVFASLDTVLDEMGDGMGLLTPHALTPLPDAEGDDGEPAFMEPAFLNCGIFNLGFLAIADRPGRLEFLSWWEDRCSRWGYIRPGSGLFTDQLWMNLAPIFFGGFRISRNRGLNMAYWNLHERSLAPDADGRLLVNGGEPLVFFHFSTIDAMRPEEITRIPINTYTLENRPDLKDVFVGYTRALLENGQPDFARISCVFSSMREEYVLERALLEKRARLERAPVAYRFYLAATWVRATVGDVARWLTGPLRRRLPRRWA